jgi:tight adherence protein B
MVIFLVLLAFVVGVGFVMGGYTAVAKLPEILLQRRLDTRLQEVSQPQVAASDETPAKRLVKVQHEGPLPGVDRFLGTTTRGSALGQWIDQSGMRLSLSGVLLIAFGLAVLFALIAAVVVRSPLAWPVGAALGFAIPFVFLSFKRTRRMRAFEEQFPEGLDLIARALKAGHAFATGLKMVADEMPEPVGPEFRKTFDEQNFGLPLKDALDNLTVRMPSLDVRFFATAVLIQRETGGNLSEILENLAHVVRERFKILRQVRVYTAHGRFTGYVLLALPAVLCIALSFINPEHMNLLFRERMGQMMLLGALALQTTGYVWIKQVIKIEV